MMKYPEFEQDSDDEDDGEEEEDEDDEEGNIKLPNLITKETVLAVLKPNGVSFRFTLFAILSAKEDLYQLTLRSHLSFFPAISLSKLLSTSALSRMSRLSNFPFPVKSEFSFFLSPRCLPSEADHALLYSPVYLTGHYIRQEDFDQEPYSDSEDGSEFDEEFDDSDISGLIGEGSEDEDMEDRIQELKEEKP